MCQSEKEEGRGVKSWQGKPGMLLRNHKVLLLEYGGSDTKDPRSIFIHMPTCLAIPMNMKVCRDSCRAVSGTKCVPVLRSTTGSSSLSLSRGLEVVVCTVLGERWTRGGRGRARGRGGRRRRRRKYGEEG
eukprot:768760-Hanusia_phi.AAC.1